MAAQEELRKLTSLFCTEGALPTSYLLFAQNIRLIHPLHDLEKSSTILDTLCECKFAKLASSDRNLALAKLLHQLQKVRDFTHSKPSPNDQSQPQPQPQPIRSLESRALIRRSSSDAINTILRQQVFTQFPLTLTNDVSISYASWEKVVARQWVCDTVMDGFFIHLSADCRATRTRTLMCPTFCFTPRESIFKVAGQSPSERGLLHPLYLLNLAQIIFRAASRHLSPDPSLVDQLYNPFTAFDNIMFPVNYGGSHWTLVVANIPRKRVDLYDPMIRAKRDAMHSFEVSPCFFVLRVLNLIHWLLYDNQLPDLAEWTISVALPQFPQTDGHSCGPICCLYADLLRDDHTINLVRPSSSFAMDQLRFFMATRLYESRL